MQKILLFLGGGEVFSSREQYLQFLQQYPYNIGGIHYSWKRWISAGLEHTHKSVHVDFPCKENADYDAWKIWFEKYIETYITTASHVTIIAHSLGGIFIAKYLCENTFPLSIAHLHMVAPVFSDDLPTEESIGNFAFEPKQLAHVSQQVKNIHLWHSKDDPIVPYTHCQNFKKHLSGAIIHTFTDRGHFVNQPHFIELFSAILEQDEKNITLEVSS